MPFDCYLYHSSNNNWNNTDIIIYPATARDFTGSESIQQADHFWGSILTLNNLSSESLQ